MLTREMTKLARTLGGMRDMTKVPSVVWVVDTNKEHIAVGEARKLGIPVVALLDTNCDPDVVDYPIPANDDAIRSVGVLTKVIASAVAEGLKARSQARKSTGEEAEPLAEWEAEQLDQVTGETTAPEAEKATEAAVTEAPAAEATATEEPAAVAEAPAAEAAAVESTEA